MEPVPNGTGSIVPYLIEFVKRKRGFLPLPQPLRHHQSKPFAGGLLDDDAGGLESPHLQPAHAMEVVQDIGVAVLFPGFDYIKILGYQKIR